MRRWLRRSAGCCAIILVIVTIGTFVTGGLCPCNLAQAIALWALSFFSLLASCVLAIAFIFLRDDAFRRYSN